MGKPVPSSDIRDRARTAPSTAPNRAKSPTLRPVETTAPDASPLYEGGAVVRAQSRPRPAPRPKDYDPNHPSTQAAWHAVSENLVSRDGYAGSRTVAVSIAQRAGLDYKRATDLIRSSIRHGYLEVLEPNRIRLTTQVKP